MPTHRLFMRGTVPDDVAAQLIAYAKSCGYTVSRVDIPELSEEPLPEPTWTDEELRHVDPLSEASDMYTRPAEYRQQLASLGVRVAADLTRMPFLKFLQPERGLIRKNLRVKGEVLELMIRHRICFSDLDPASALRTHVTRTDMSVRAANSLQREGVNRVELLAYFTEVDVSNIRNVGTKCFNEIRTELAKLDLVFKGE